MLSCRNVVSSIRKSSHLPHRPLDDGADFDHAQYLAITPIREISIPIIDVITTCSRDHVTGYNSPNSPTTAVTSLTFNSILQEPHRPSHLAQRLTTQHPHNPTIDCPTRFHKTTATSPQTSTVMLHFNASDASKSRCRPADSRHRRFLLQNPTQHPKHSLSHSKQLASLSRFPISVAQVEFNIPITASPLMATMMMTIAITTRLTVSIINSK